MRPSTAVPVSSSARGWLVLSTLLAVAPACALVEPSDASEHFSDELGQMQDEFGAGKADFLGLDIDPCTLLRPLASFGHDALHSGLAVGVEGDAVLGPAVGLSGFNLVWDLYHQQMTVSRYAGAGVGVPGAGASVEAYAGAAFGFEDGVEEWNGYFVTAEVQIGLPFLTDYLSLAPEGYATAVDASGDGLISPSEVLVPPEGVYGFNVGVKLGFDLLPSPLPIQGSLTEGRWQPYKEAIRHYYDELSSTLMFGVWKMQLRLIDSETGEPCPAGWPERAGDQSCVIEFGDPDDSYVRRSLDTAYSICTLTGRCDVPLTWPMSANAMAIGALRSSGLSFDEMCSD